MDVIQIAIFLQIMGILIGTGFGTILLNPEIIGKTAERINTKFLSIGNTFTERCLKILKLLLLGGELAPAVTQAISVSMIIIGAWSILLIALQRNISWIAWV